MSHGFKDHFSGHAAAYAAARPDYPAELFTWLASKAPARECVWDCATGNGQAALALASHFERVIATDASAAQIANATAQTGIDYRVASAEKPGLEPASVDLVTVAQAAHWFDRPRFYVAARDAMREGGLIALWSYGLFEIERELDTLIGHFYRETVGPYWPPDRHWIDERYATLEFPFAEITPPEFAMSRMWTLAQVLAYLRTWSAAQRYQKTHGRDPLSLIETEIGGLWGEADQRKVRWPLYLRVGYRD